MLTEINISGFKSYKNKSIPLMPLTLLSGLNNSGKSTILQAIRLYGNYDGEESNLLPDHGSVDELKSNLSSKTDDIHISCKFIDGRYDELILNNGKLITPKIIPRICYLSADRLGPQKWLPIQNQITTNPRIGSRGEYVIGYLNNLERGMVPKELRHPTSEGAILQYQIPGWLNEISPGISFNYTTYIKRDASFASFDGFRPSNVGFGLSYCLPIISLILGESIQSPENGWDNEWADAWMSEKLSRGSLILIENPEAHLHPKGQTALGKLIALGASQGVQIIVESQSDHLMDGIRIAVKDKKIASEKVAFHYLTKNNDEETNIASPKIFDDGKLEFWPEGFFDQALVNRAKLAR